MVPLLPSSLSWLKEGHYLRESIAVKTMTDADGNQLKDAPPATPVRVTGWSDVPLLVLNSTEKNEKAAKRSAEENMQVRKLDDAANAQQPSTEAATIEDLFAAIENSKKKCLRNLGIRCTVRPKHWFNSKPSRAKSNSM